MKSHSVLRRVPLLQSFSDADLADLVGTTRESINKELKVLRGRGLVSTEGGHMHLLDLERLKRRVH
jgi:CRP-like cAMP-binding protein